MTASGSRVRAVTLIVLDSVGIGAAHDADAFGDAGSATLPHVAEAVGGLALPNLERLGLGRLAEIQGVAAVPDPDGATGTMQPASAGKDTTTGHWELAGVVLEKPFPTYPNGFPQDIIQAFEEVVGREVLGNVPASGTEIIEQLGPEHVATGKPIVYTSADSVFQLAAHTDVVPLEDLYAMCRAARELLTGEHRVGRVIARPFTGSPGSYSRTPDRHDFSVEPPANLLDSISGAGLEVVGVGKISDIFAGRGVTSSRPTRDNTEGTASLIEAMGAIRGGLVFANLVDFDQAFGHRNDPQGYARALEAFDAAVPALADAAGPETTVLITADHGNDPTTPSTDHSRERVPLLAWGAGVRPGAELGERPTFADCAATIADLLGVSPPAAGTSFADLLRGGA